MAHRQDRQGNTRLASAARGFKMIENPSFTYDSHYYDQGIGGFHAASTDRFRPAEGDGSLSGPRNVGGKKTRL